MFDNCIPWQQLDDCRPFLCAAKGVACETMNKDGRRENSLQVVLHSQTEVGNVVSNTVLYSVVS